LAKLRIPHNDNVVVIGLGRFGSSVAENLQRLGHDVLGIDTDPDLVQSMADRLTHVIQADANEAETLRRLGIGDYKHAVVGIGSNIEASLLATLALSELGVANIWAKAISTNHGRILSRTGAHHVVFPEAEMGARVAHLVTGHLIDFIEFDDGFSLGKVRAPKAAACLSLSEAKWREKFGITVVGIKPDGGEFIYATPETILKGGEMLIVSGPTQKVEAFATLA
jgi:trk system potassium uptake protein